MARLTTINEPLWTDRHSGIINIKVLQKKMVNAASPILENSLRQAAQSHRETGDMAAAIKAAKAKDTASGVTSEVYPTGTGRNGTRNMAKLAYLEYGTYKQRATPIIKQAVFSSRDRIFARMQQVYDEEAGK